MSRPMKMGMAALVVSGSILLSRILGLVRDILLATMIGVNVEGDLYRHAFLIPDFLNYLLAGAYLTITLIPILSRHLERGDREAASRAFTSVFRFVAIAIGALTVVMWLFTEQLVALAFPSVPDPERLVSLTRLVLPAQIFLVLGALLMAVQYTHKRFMFPAFAPLVYNIGIIGGGLIGAAVGEPTPESFLWGAVVGSAIGNFGLQWIGARRTGTWFRKTTRADSAVGEYLILALPLMIGQSIATLDEQFVRLFGQVDEGATSALFFARQLNMVPIGVIAQAAGVAAFPFLAQLAARGDTRGLSRTTSRATRTTVFIAFAATAALIAVAVPLVRILYQYGRFTEADAAVVAGLLAIYALSIPAWGLHQILARHFYAQRRMWIPVVTGTVFTAASIPLWLWLREARGIEGMAIASVVGITGYALGLGVIWWRDTGREFVRPVGLTIFRGLVAAAVATSVGRWVVEAILGDGAPTIGGSVLALILGGLLTLSTFGVVALLVRAPELRELRQGDEKAIEPVE